MHWTIATVSALLLLTAGVASGRSIYVSPLGDDASAGTQDAPLRTPIAAVEAAAAGDTVWLRQGRYLLDRPLWVEKAGVTIVAFPGERATLVAPNSDENGPAAVVIVVADRVSLINLEIVGGAYYGVKVDVAEEGGSTRGVSIRGCRIRDTGADCVKTFNADELLIEDCQIGPSGVRVPSNAEGIDVIGSRGVRIRRCHVHDTATNGIYLKGGTTDGIVEACLVRNTGGFGGILLGQDTDAESMRDGAEHEAIRCAARNNIIVNTGAAGLGTYSGSDIAFENNTLVDVARDAQAGLWIVTNERGVPARRVRFRNNIVLMSSPRPLVCVRDLGDPLVSDSNVYFNSSSGGGGTFRRESSAREQLDDWDIAQWRQQMRADERSQVCDPMLDPAAQYRPRAGSPALGRGEALKEVGEDYDGAPRPTVGACDIGAHQHRRQQQVQVPAQIGMSKVKGRNP